MSVLSGTYKLMSVVSQIILNHQQKPTDTYGRQHPLINILLAEVIKQIVSRNGNQHVYQINIAYRRVYPINNKQDTHCFLRKRAGNSLPTDARKSKPLHIMRHDQLSEHNR